MYQIVGKSRATEKLRKQIAQLAKTEKDVLIIGEAGVGKGTVAKNIYLASQRGVTAKPFVTVNLAALDDKEFDPVLFGVDETLTETYTPGLLKSADGGVVFIEELEEASFRNQMKILKFINERKVPEPGTETWKPIDVRIIVSLKEEISPLVVRNKLIEELGKKLAQFEKVYVPPLRSRPEDIPLLVRHFADEIARELGIGNLAIDANAIEVLVKQTWKENIRELRSVIDKAVLFSKDGQFELPPELVDERVEVAKMINNILEGRGFSLGKSLDIIEKRIIERALERFGFNQSRAAAFLGLNEQTLRYKLKRLGIPSYRARQR